MDGIKFTDCKKKKKSVKIEEKEKGSSVRTKPIQYFRSKRHPGKGGEETSNPRRGHGKGGRGWGKGSKVPSLSAKEQSHQIMKMMKKHESSDFKLHFLDKKIPPR